ncbi:hypothetical protein ACFYUV_11340 [Nonomuraea sp. NPDC003560]|uniref:hypothetical protein n=1 Tax=Nonomuraea sp. NPDC003560 TaxID=3364341 RepID=UPI00368E5A49
MTDFNASAQVVALVTGMRSGLELHDILKMTNEAVREGATSDKEVIYRLGKLVGAFAATTACICQAWDEADGTAVATRFMSQFGQMVAAQGSDETPP